MKNVLNVFSLIIISGMIFMSCSNTSKQSKTADATDCVEMTAAGEGWITLFNGTDFTGWRGYNRADMPSAWTIEDGAIKINGSGMGEAGAKDGGDIIYDQKFKNFELTFEWKVSEGGNSGVFYLAQELEGKQIYESAPEYQILDNAKHPDAKLGKDGNRQSASLYDLVPAVPQNSKPAGEWNTGGIMVYKGTVIHTQNGENVVEYHLWTDSWKEMVAGSKFKNWPDFLNAGGENQEGYIGLQDHGDDVWYRNIKIKILD
ncbi:3-keto-disaccharide hydrolase [Proteiniphilum sp. UBA5463]|uniref:3-keto-disaccharide hydrolase n=1 Tax=Proteiniphilum sp. UBA5463 TaxID=1947281 RepID=UPI00257B90D9|nr:DUF1080 domain-containing protein [Proteiniphilum sp. UBA5463]